MGYIEINDRILLIDIRIQKDIETNTEAEKYLRELKQYETELRNKTGKIVKCAVIYCKYEHNYLDKDSRFINVDGETIYDTTVNMNVKKKYLDYKLNETIKILEEMK